MIAISAAEVGARVVEFFAFEYAFTAYALAASVIVGLLCGVVGTFMVLRGLALVGDAAGHATLPGVCVGFLILAATGNSAQAEALPVLLGGAFASSVLATVMIGVLSRGPRSRPDAAIASSLSIFFGLGVVLLSYVQNSPTGAQAGLGQFLYGNAAGVTSGQVLTLAVLAVVLLAAHALLWRWLVISSFDDTFAVAVGIPTRAVRVGILMALSVAVVVSIQAVGVVLVSAMLLIPASTALFFTKRIERTVALSAALGAAAGALGAVTSYVFEGVATGPAMVLVSGAMFGVALLVGPRGGLLVRR